MNREDIEKLIKETLNYLSIEFEGIECLEPETGRPVYSVTSKESGLLIGSSGETLKALNYIVKRIAERRSSPDEKVALLLDVNGYQQKKLEELANQARMLAERARMFKSSVEMSPMNSYERMVIHSLFTDDPEICTKSEGEGKFRHVVLLYGKKESVSEEFAIDSID